MLAEMLCTVCLSKGRNLLPVTKTVIDVINKLLDFKHDKMNLCWECTADLKHAVKFQKKYTHSKWYLENYCKNNVRDVENNTSLFTSKTSVYCYPDEQLNIQESHFKASSENNYNKMKNIASKENMGVYGDTHIKKVRHARLFLKSSNETGAAVVQTSKIKIQTLVKKIRKRRRRIAKTEFTCKQCGETFGSRGKYEYHVRKHRGRCACAQCGSMFVNKAALTAHVANKHSRIKKERMRIYCHPCCKFFETNSSYKKHLRTSLKHVDTGQWQHVCPSCPKRFRDESEVRTHHDTVHMGIKHECTQCRRRYCSVRAMRAHAQRKHGAWRAAAAVCEVCGKIFKTPQILKCHQKIHLRERKGNIIKK